VYAASKAALNSLTETLRAELAQKKSAVRVVCVMPGVVKTDFGTSALGGGPDSRALPGGQEAPEVAKIIADAALTKNGDVYTRPDGLERVLGYLRELGE
jgi:NAD(P)-dependent dehydrogenase (short-subunit alcohol dehydrogenase family)